jgi:hypothetical protein
VFLVDASSSVTVLADGALSPHLCIKDGIPHTQAEVVDPDGSKRKYMRPIGSYRFLAVERLLDRAGRQSITAITIDRNTDQHVVLEIGSKELASAKDLSALMFANGIYMNDQDVTALRTKFLPMFLAQLQRARAANQIASRCGWTDDRTGFVLGTALYTAKGVEHVRPAAAPDEMKAYHVAGDEAKWRKAFDLTLAGGPDRQAVVALSIAAPLMVFTGVDGVMLNAYSPESGTGKSTLCDAALSVWGSPNKLRKDFRDTTNATSRLAAVVGNLPMVVDEFTNIEGKALSDYVYTITQGREKHRMSADAKLNLNNDRWCLPTIVTSNNSIHDKLQAYRPDAVAEAARVFELRLHPLQVPKEAMGGLKLDLLAIRDHYGFLGPKLIELYLSRDPAQWEETVSKRIAWWDKNVSSDTSDRFRSVIAALIEIGAAIGTAMGYAFDQAAIVEVIKTQWQEQQQEFEAAKRQPTDFINSYIVDNLSSFAFLGGQNADAMMSTQQRFFKGEVRGKSKDGKYTPMAVIIPQNLLRDYVREKNGNYKALLEWVKSELKNPNGVVSAMGPMPFLEGQYQEVRTAAIAFRPAVLGATVLRVVQPEVTTAPPPPVAIGRAKK